MKKVKIKFMCSGNLTWVSKSGKSEQPQFINENSIMNVILTESETTNCFDIRDGNWTAYGIGKDKFSLIN